MVAMLAVLGIGIFWSAKTVLFWGDTQPAVAMAAESTAPSVYVPTATMTPTVDIAALVAAEIQKVQASSAAGAAAAAAAVVQEVLPTSTPLVHTIYESVYVDVPIEVTRIVSVEIPSAAPVVLATVTPTLADGVVVVCVSASGVKELYVSGVGVVGGGCHSLQVGAGSTMIEVQVNR
jgi:cytoskeletal protein RodZ